MEKRELYQKVRDFVEKLDEVDGVSDIEGEATIGLTDDDGHDWFITVEGA